MQSFESSKISDYFGIELMGIDLSKKLKDKYIEIIKKLFHENHIVVFRNQNLTDEEQLSFTRNFGELEIFPEADKTKDSLKTYHVANVSLEGKHLTDK
ncbi:MAG TPA: TauD/TfdA family dioxygenase, partial [Alphaproteobacteria bacterium]|nr:TauD/TfdA family dioxygenase [Alphaproteobacteria bacterium]